MTQSEVDPFEADELQLLASARRGLEPNAHDAARVLHGARLAIAAGAAPSVPDVDTRTLASSGKLAIAGVAPKLLAALIIASVSGGIGYQLGVHEGAEHARAPHPSSLAARVPVVAQASAIAPISALPHAQAPAIANAPVPVSGEGMASAVIDAGIASTRVRSRRTTPAATELAANAPIAAAQAQPEVAEDEANAVQSLDPEVRALRQIERALRKREPERALTLLQQLDREVPSGKLAEERAAAFAMARCDLGIGTPMTHALEFSQRYPASVYFARVRQTCSAQTDSGTR